MDNLMDAEDRVILALILAIGVGLVTHSFGWGFIIMAVTFFFLKLTDWIFQ